MGQKTRPTGFRVGIVESWRSRWYANKKEFGALLVEDQKIRRFIADEYKSAAIERVEELSGADNRWQPESLSLATALDNSRKDQTYNTPAVATLILLAEQLEWMNGQGGLDWCVERCRSSSDHLYRWAEASEYATPFVQDEAKRSLVVGTIDFDEDKVDAAALAAALRANGIVDTEPYRKLGRNQLRIGMFPGIDTSDLQALTASIEWLIDNHDGVRA